MRHLTPEEAQEIVWKFLKNIESKDRELAISHIESFEYGWVFYWNSKKYLETRDFLRHSLIGNVPIIIDKTNGNAYNTGTARKTADYLDEFMKAKEKDHYPKWKKVNI